jgi:hypothetical protein
MRTPYVAAFAAALGALAALPASAQNPQLIHRYSFNGNANDSVGGANGTVVNNVTFTTSTGTNGVATFGGGNSNASPSYISLPTSTVTSLQNGTLEDFVTSFAPNAHPAGGNYEALFDESIAWSTTETQQNYLVLCANRGTSANNNGGLGTGSRINGVNTDANGTDFQVATGSPLPGAGGLVTLVYSGFTGVGTTGTETIYLNGVQVAQRNTVYSFAYIPTGTGGVGTVGIGGGSPWNDPTFQGSMDEFRIWNGALTASQVMADYLAGPGVVAVPEPSALAGLALGALGLGVLVLKARKRSLRA